MWKLAKDLEAVVFVMFSLLRIQKGLGIFRLKRALVDESSFNLMMGSAGNSALVQSLKKLVIPSVAISRLTISVNIYFALGTHDHFHGL